MEWRGCHPGCGMERVSPWLWNGEGINTGCGMEKWYGIQWVGAYRTRKGVVFKYVCVFISWYLMWLHNLPSLAGRVFLVDHTVVHFVFNVFWYAWLEYWVPFSSGTINLLSLNNNKPFSNKRKGYHPRFGTEIMSRLDLKWRGWHNEYGTDKAPYHTWNGEGAIQHVK